MTMTMGKTMFDLAGSLAVEGPDIVVRYKGVNTAHESLLVAQLPSDVGFKVYPDAAYCSLSPDDERINFILGDSPFPYDREVEFGVGAFFKRVLPGEYVKGELRFGMPIQEWSGYFPPSRNIKTELVSVRQVVLRVDFVPHSAARWMRPARNAPDYWSVDGPFATSSLDFLLSEPLPVAKRNDNFPRPS